jgi:hypothetical protein
MLGRFCQPCRSLHVRDPTHGNLGRSHPARLVSVGRALHSSALRRACDAPPNWNKSFQSPRRVRPLADPYRAMHFVLASKGSPNRRSPFFPAADCLRQPHRLRDSQHPSNHYRQRLTRGSLAQSNRCAPKLRRVPLRARAMVDFPVPGRPANTINTGHLLGLTIAIDTVMDQCPVCPRLVHHPSLQIHPTLL